MRQADSLCRGNALVQIVLLLLYRVLRGQTYRCLVKILRLWLLFYLTATIGGLPYLRLLGLAIILSWLLFFFFRSNFLVILSVSLFALFISLFLAVFPPIKDSLDFFILLFFVVIYLEKWWLLVAAWAQRGADVAICLLK